MWQVAKLVAQGQTLHCQGGEKRLASDIFPGIFNILLCTLAFYYLFKMTTVKNNTVCIIRYLKKINTVTTQ